MQKYEEFVIKRKEVSESINNRGKKYQICTADNMHRPNIFLCSNENELWIIKDCQ